MDKNNKVFNVRVYDYISEGGEAVIGTTSEFFVMNYTSQFFYSQTSIIMANGIARGMKICSGKFFSGNDIKKLKK